VGVFLLGGQLRLKNNMPVFSITSPEGVEYEVAAPDGATPEQAFANLQKYLGSPTPTSNTPQIPPKVAPDMRSEAPPATPVAPKREAIPRASFLGGLADRITHFESGGNPEAVSHKGAVGLMQLMPATAKEVAKGLGLKFSKERLKNPDYNRKLGTEYLRQMLDKYEDNPILAVAAYNAGPGRVDKWIERFGDPRGGVLTDEEFAKKIPIRETRNYVRNVLELEG
jgi:soluble lytic murein transglycosylase